MHKSSFKIQPWVVVLTITSIGFLLRVFNVHWDSGFYLNPDERFLTMLALALKLPQSLSQYFNQSISLLNPANLKQTFFVYGHLPLNLAKLFSVLIKYDNYGSFYVVGRLLSALADASIILAVYLSAKTLTNSLPKAKNNFPILASLVYAVLVYPIQISHSFTIDTFLNAFFVWSLYFALNKKTGLAALCFGLGLASKITALLTLPLVLALLINKKKLFNRAAMLKNVGAFSLFALISYLTLRLADPYLFAKPSWLNPTLSSNFLESLKQLQSYGKTQFYPPSLQWLNQSPWFGIKNMALYGLGPIFFFLSLAGGAYFSFKKTVKVSRKKNWFDLLFNPMVLIIFWLMTFTTWQSLQFVKTMRYFIFVYPILALLIGYTLSILNKRLRVILFLAGFFWTFLFMQIYINPHPRVSASYWIFQNLPHQSKIVWEYWDDPLPLAVQTNKSYNWIQIDYYEKDSNTKWLKIAKKLKLADYIILSSDRQYRPIIANKELYPITSKYYLLLLQSKLGFKKVREFASFPGLEIGPWKWEINDSQAEEVFTVYDHPQVIIFEKMPGFSEKRLLNQLGFELD